MDLRRAYAVLEIPFNAPLEKIKKVFKILAKKKHPDKSKEPDANEKFMEINAAYKVLLNSKSVDTKSTKKETKKNEKSLIQPEPNECELPLTLEEIFHGCSKDVQIHRKIVDEEGQEEEETAFLRVNVEAGTLEKHRLPFKYEGDRYHGKKPANLVFTVRSIAHGLFQRNRFDLIHTATITTQQACFGEVSVPLIEGGMKKLSLGKHITSDSVEILPNLGLPIPKEKRRGALKVKFKIIFEEDKPQDPPIKRDLSLTLKQILEGCTKKVKINRLIVDQDGNETFEDKIFTIVVPRGTEAGTEFTFLMEGDRYPDTLPANILFVTKDKLDFNFQREGANVTHQHQLTESEAKEGCTFELTLFDDSQVTVSIEEPITDSTKKHFQGRGLPVAGSEDQRGDLIVEFEVVDDDEIDEPVEHLVSLSLEQVLNGFTKNFSITRTKEFANGDIVKEAKIFPVEFPAGTESGQKVVFPGEGNQYPGVKPADVVFIARDKPHPTFLRKGANLEYTAKLTQRKFMNSQQLNIPTLDGIEKVLSLQEIFNPASFSKKFPSLGLPIQGDPSKRGDLIVRIELIEDLQDEPIEIEIFLTADQLNNGFIKKWPFKRSITNRNGHQRQETDLITVEILPGMMPGKRIVFDRYGHQTPGRIPADVVFILREKVKDEPIETDLAIELKDILTGCTKNIEILKYIIEDDGTESEVKKKLEIIIPPGTEAGEEFVFESEGDQYPDSIPADMIFIARDKKHERFYRNGADIEFYLKITQSEAENGFEKTIATLEENDFVTVTIMEPVDENDRKSFEGKGLPLKNEPQKRGDFVVIFKIDN